MSHGNSKRRGRRIALGFPGSQVAKCMGTIFEVVSEPYKREGAWFCTVYYTGSPERTARFPALVSNLRPIGPAAKALLEAAR